VLVCLMVVGGVVAASSGGGASSCAAVAENVADQWEAEMGKLERRDMAVAGWRRYCREEVRDDEVRACLRDAGSLDAVTTCDDDVAMPPEEARVDCEAVVRKLSARGGKRGDDDGVWSRWCAKASDTARRCVLDAGPSTADVLACFGAEKRRKERRG
jgi:hypothetical protein